jgi:hypothetical protein
MFLSFVKRKAHVPAPELPASVSTQSMTINQPFHL